MYLDDVWQKKRFYFDADAHFVLNFMKLCQVIYGWKDDRYLYNITVASVQWNGNDWIFRHCLANELVF